MSRVRQFALASVATLAIGAPLQSTVRADDKPTLTSSPGIQAEAQSPAPSVAPAVTIAPPVDSPPATEAKSAEIPAKQLPDVKVPVVQDIVGVPAKDLLPPAQAAAASVAPVIAPPDAVKPEPAASASTTTPPPAPPAFALATELSERIVRDKSPANAREDRDAAVKFYEARKGAPLWVSEAGLTPAAQALIVEIGKAGDYGLSADAFKVPASLAPNATRADLADAEATLTLAALKYARYARGGRMDPGALSRSIDRKAQTLPASSVLEALAAADKPDAALRGFHPLNPQFEKLRLKYVALRAGQPVIDAPPPVAPAATPAAAPAAAPKGKKVAGTPVAKVMSPAALEKKLLANLEMWRWMPDMGNTYIQPNIPEYTVSVVRDGKLIHKERIVTGKPDTMTPIFSDSMRLIVFKPFWNVPESIKYKELQPGLLSGKGTLERAGLRAEINGKVVDSAAVDWIDVDMRQVHIFQPPGEANALGRVKFLFPNKHDVYLHDTPSKSLFNQSVRAYSHGCMRVRDPLKLAEVILSNDKGWTRAQVDRQAASGPDNTEIKLTTPIPVHITYFTAWVDDEGKLQTVADIYGHENRIQLGLEGKINLIAQQREDRYVPPSAEERRRFAEQRQKKSSDPLGDWVKSVFNF